MEVANSSISGLVDCSGVSQHGDKGQTGLILLRERECSFDGFALPCCCIEKKSLFLKRFTITPAIVFRASATLVMQSDRRFKTRWLKR